MTATSFIQSLLPAIFLCASAGADSAVPVRPNIVLIVVDDLKPLMGCYNDTIARTPAIDRLARTGFVFKNNHCQQAVCAPTRVSMLTGKRPDFTMVWDLKTQMRQMIPSTLTLPQYLRSFGYQTAAAGKVFDSRSVDRHHDSLSWSIAYEPIRGADDRGDGWVITKEKLSTEAPDVPDSCTIDGRILDKSVGLLKQLKNSGSPFFLAVGFHKPHLPFVAPKSYWDLYRRESFRPDPNQGFAEGTPTWAYQPGWELRSGYTDIPKQGRLPDEKQMELIHGYYACVSFIDQQIGVLLQQLKTMQLDQNTIVVLTGDHGWHLGDHGIWCKHTNFEQATRSPMIISYGNRLIGETLSPTEFVDLFPTICSLSRVPVPAGVDGCSLTEMMKNNRKSVKSYAVSQFHRNDTLMGYAFRDERYRYVVWLKENFRSYKSFRSDLIVAQELYDYKVDPAETRNFISDPEYDAVKKQFENESIHFFVSQEKSINH